MLQKMVKVGKVPNIWIYAPHKKMFTLLKTTKSQKYSQQIPKKYT